MIEREYYSIQKDRRICVDGFEDLIHLAATGRIAIHALVSDLLIDPYTLDKAKSLCLLERKKYNGLVQIETENVLRFEADSFGDEVEILQLPPFDETNYAYPLAWHNYGNPGFGVDWSLAERSSLLMANLHLVITAKEWDKASKYFAPEGEDTEHEQLQNGSANKLDKPLGTKERRTLLTIIAALCKKAKIDPQARGAAGKVMNLVEETVGAQIDEGTIKKFLDQIPDALESRMK